MHVNNDTCTSLQLYSWKILIPQSYTHSAQLIYTKPLLLIASQQKLKIPSVILSFVDYKQAIWHIVCLEKKHQRHAQDACQLQSISFLLYSSQFFNYYYLKYRIIVIHRCTVQWHRTFFICLSLLCLKVRVRRQGQPSFGGQEEYEIKARKPITGCVAKPGYEPQIF